MSFPYRTLKRACTLAMSLGAGFIFARADAAGGNSAPPAVQVPTGGGPGNVPVSGLFPNGEKEPAQDPRGKQYEGNPQAIAIGAKLFDWYNCSGCHFHGAGGIGPAFNDSEWIYGGRIDQIYASIYQGRPNGMPMWGKIIPSTAIWQIAAYVKSLETNASKVPIPTKPVPAAPGPATLETEPGQAAAPAH